MTKERLHSTERSTPLEETAEKTAVEASEATCLNKTLALNPKPPQTYLTGSSVEGTVNVESTEAIDPEIRNLPGSNPEDQLTDQTQDLSTAAAREIDAMTTVQSLEPSTARSGAKSGQPCIMVIDDSKTIRRSAKSLLSKEGWQVVTAEDGFDALSKIVEHKPDIVFVDIMMPRLDGYQTCALIKNNANYNSTPVIMLSSKDSIFDKARGRVVGSEHYLTKPFTRDDLLSTIQKHALSGPDRNRSAQPDALGNSG